MKENKKQLLLKVLSEMLPYGVICDVLGRTKKLLAINPWKKFPLEFDNGEYIPNDYTLEDVKPYLRPMESMTEEEIRELSSLGSGLIISKDVLRDIILDVMYKTNAIDWLNKNHFDYRGLIPMGLALPATTEMYK